MRYMVFTKLHATILDSSVWQEPAHVRLVWITMLAMADQNGVVQASVGGLAHRARVSREECVEALAKFLGPDPDSRDRTTGERIEQVPGGWLVLNHANYRDRQTRQQAMTAARVARHREKKAAEDEESVRYVTQGNETSPDISGHLSPSASEYASAFASGLPSESGSVASSPNAASDDGGATHTPPPTRSANGGGAKARHEAVEHDPAFLAFWNAYGYKVDKVLAAKSWSRIAPSAELAAEIARAASAYAAATPDKQFRKHAATWLNNRCWENDPQVARSAGGGKKTGGQLWREANDGSSWNNEVIDIPNVLDGYVPLPLPPGYTEK